MRRADRLFRLVQALRRGRLMTARALAAQMEVSERTIYRDIRDLQVSGVPIDGEAGVGYVLRGYDLPPLMFTQAEVEALALGARMVMAWGGHAIAKGAADALDKIDTVLPEDLARRMAQTPLHAPNFHLPEGLPEILDRLTQAIQQRRTVSLTYRALDQQESQREVRPLALHFWGGVWTLATWCELRAGFRNFRVDRIQAFSVLERTFSDEPGKTLSDFLAQYSSA